MYEPSEHMPPRLQKQLKAFSDMKNAKEIHDYLWVICAAFATMPAAACWQIIEAMFS